jgi:hypothetical protein
MGLLQQKVNSMRTRFILAITVLTLLGTQTSAEEKKWYYPFEIGELKIKQSNDGSGIIKEVTCSDCDFQFVKITPDTKVFVNNINVDVLRARDRAGKAAYIEFDKATAEVKHIYWSE